MKITAKVIEPLVQKHITRYESRLSAAGRGLPGFLPEELKFYLGLWESIKRKKCNPVALTREEKAEVLDALMDETDSIWEW